MKTVLTIRQPWAWLIVRPDLIGDARVRVIRRNLIKDIENRDWPTNFRGRFHVHAGKYLPSSAELAGIEQEMGIAIVPDQLRYGGIIGSAECVDCVEKHESKWFFGRYGFVLTDSRPCDFLPIARGQPGHFFKVE